MSYLADWIEFAGRIHELMKAESPACSVCSDVGFHVVGNGVNFCPVRCEWTSRWSNRAVGYEAAIRTVLDRAARQGISWTAPCGKTNCLSCALFVDDARESAKRRALSLMTDEERAVHVVLFEASEDML